MSVDDDLEALHRCDRYLDLAPRTASEPTDIGPLRVFLSRAPWPYYARPRPELDLTGPDAVRASHLAAAAQRLTALGYPASFEWVDDLVPSLDPVARAAGYDVTLHPLLVRDAGDHVTGIDDPRDVVVAPGSPLVREALAVADVAFDGTADPDGGPAARDACDVPPERVAYVDGRIASGEATLVAVVDPVDGVVASGSHLPVGGTSEIVGVATLPAHRRRGLAGLVVTALVVDAAARGVELVLLSAGDDDAARVYERVGFRRIGRVGAAEQAADPDLEDLPSR